MKYLNHINAVLAIIGVAILVNTLMQTYWQPATTKSPKSGDVGALPAAPASKKPTATLPNMQSRRPSSSSPANKSPLGAPRISVPATSTARSETGLPEKRGVVGQPAETTSPSDGLITSPNNPATGMVGVPQAPVRSLTIPSGDSGDPAGAGAAADPRLNRRVPSRRYPTPGSRYLGTQSTSGATKRQPDTNPNSPNTPNPPTRASMP